MSEYTVKLSQDETIYLVIAPDGEAVVHQSERDNYDYDVEALIAANHYADKCNLQMYKDELATANAALQEQSQALALARQNADAAAELLKRDEATIKELQERNARLLDMVNTKESEKVELAKTIAQREELLRIQGGMCERYKYALEEILENIPVKPTLPLVSEIRSIAETSLAETQASASKESEESE